MKQVTPNGHLIKELRSNLEKNSTQKELSYAICISERKLRQIENENAPISVKTLDRLAKELGVRREQISMSQPVTNILPASEHNIFEAVLNDFRKEKLVPRFDYDLATVTMDEGRLIKSANQSNDFVCEIMVPLTDMTAQYAEDLIAALTSLTWSERSILDTITSTEEIILRRRVKQLMVLLRGNDIWIYHTTLFRRLPERHTLPPENEPSELSSRFIVALAAPGEYGETSIEVQVDHGQPFIIPALDGKVS